MFGAMISLSHCVCAVCENFKWMRARLKAHMILHELRDSIFICNTREPFHILLCSVCLFYFSKEAWLSIYFVCDHNNNNNNSLYVCFFLHKKEKKEKEEKIIEKEKKRERERKLISKRKIVLAQLKADIVGHKWQP